MPRILDMCEREIDRLSLSLSLACLLAHEKSSAVRSIQFSSRSQLDSNHSLSNRRRERTFKKKPVKSEIESERVRACSAEKSEPFQLPSYQVTTKIEFRHRANY